MRIIFILLVIIFLCSGSCLALDWKNLHERADKTSVEESVPAVENDPGSIDSLYLLGLVYLNAHRDIEAREAFGRMLEISPQEVAAKWGIAEVLRRQHKPDESEGILDEIIILSPGFAPALITKAYIRYTKFDFDAAIRYSQRAINLGSSKVDLTNYVRANLMIAGAKGMLAHYGGIFSKVIDGTGVFPRLKKAESMQPESAAVLFGVGSFYLLAPKFAGGGNMDKAIEYLERAVAADPLFANIYVRLAQAYKIKGDTDKYNALLNKALEIDPGNELANDIKSGTCRFICVPG
ncbi:MAG: tetratricopeptide repeat protein [Candidatus Omnitrophota bacterium]